MDQSNGFSPPEALLFQGNINENWKRWKQQLDLYLVATEKEKKSDKIKSSILLTCIGNKGRDIYNTFTWGEEEDHLNFKLVVEKFNQYCAPRKNITYLRQHLY